MTLDADLLAEKTMAVERHLRRVAERLPRDADQFAPATDAADAVILHLWQAVQIAIDVALSACLDLKLGTPTTYADAFRRLHDAGVLDEALTDRLTRAAGFRNIVAHAYETLDMRRIHRAALDGPADLRACLRAIAARYRP
jgi:uncharacterized protein YutE (UPF0331/DUF86 family)